MKTCCFIGHRKIEITNELVLSLKRVIQTLIIDENVQTFAFGSKSEFNDLCHLLVTELQKKFKGIERVCLTCRNECCLESEREKWEEIYGNVLKRKIHLQGYEREIEHKTKYISGKAAYIERNQALIDMSDFCVFYFDEKYLPAKKISARHHLSSYQPKSGTFIAYSYAEQKKKHIINLLKLKRF